MAIVTLCPSPILQFFDNGGKPCVGGSVLTQVGGVNYPAYQDAAGTIPLPNAIPLNSRGEISNAAGISCQLFLAANVAYTFTLSDAQGNQLNQSQYVNALPSSTVSFFSTRVIDSFAGDGVTTSFVLSASPGSQTNLDVDISGVDQVAGADFTWAAPVALTFIVAPPSGTTIRVKYIRSLPMGTSDAKVVQYLPGGTGALTRTVDSKLHDTVSVLDFGAVADGMTDCGPAFNAAWQAIKPVGGTLLVPPGNYFLNSQWLLDVDLTAPHNYLVQGYGATLFAGAAVTVHAIRVYKGYNNFGVKIEGFQFNHRGNTTVSGCIQGQGSSNLHILKCSVEHHNTKAAYAGIELNLYTPGFDNASTFWATIDGFKTRIRSGADGTVAATGVRLVGAANATRIVGCTFSSVVDSIRLDFEPTTGSHCNGLVIDDNSFEGVTNAVTINTATGSAGMPTGVRIINNRSESLTTFLNIAGVAVANTSYPPILQNNYATVGSVTNYLINPNNQIVFSLEPSFFGVGSRNYIGGPANFQIIADGVGKNLMVSDLSGNSNYSGAHLVMTNHFWVDSASGKLFSKATAPASGQDGQMIGSISGTSTFAGGTTLVVTIGPTMAAATYKVAISANANKTFWVSSKTTTQFTLNASAISSDLVDWLLTT